MGWEVRLAPAAYADGGARGWLALARGRDTNAEAKPGWTAASRSSSRKAACGGSAPGVPLTNLAGTGRELRISSACVLPVTRSRAATSPCRAMLTPPPPDAAVADAVASDWPRHNSESKSNAIKPEQAALIDDVNGFARLDAIRRPP